MPNPFIVQAKDDKQRRIVIDKEAWNELGLQKGDYIEVKIRKVETTKNLS
jgi:bifunctional DNA-binding transcriptional regulator/antitoxin component of YhaV-PrlF toxin-antitoxin module